jgi:hypothetical protein
LQTSEKLRLFLTMQVKKIDINWTPEISIYASEPFLKAVGDEYGCLGGFDNSGNLRCILPYTIIRKATVRMVRFRVETISIDDEFDIRQEKEFLNSAIEYFRSISADIIIPATTNTIFRTYPDRAVAAPYGTYIIDLSLSEDMLWSNLHSKHRNVIRNAIKKGVQISHGMKYAPVAYNLVRDTFKRSSLGFMGRKSFNNFIQSFNEYVKIFVADYQGEIQGCAVVPFSNHSAYYVYGGSTPKTLNGAMNLLQWEAIRYFREHGVKRYDFCGVRINPEKGSKQAGIMMFKNRFGPKLLRGFIWKCSLHPLKSAIYNCAVRWLRGGDIVDAEHHKLKNS